jgi:hypothetical protein
LCVHLPNGTVYPVATTNTAQTFSAAQTFSTRPIAGGITALSDGTAAIVLTNAAGTPVLTVDTTNSRVITAGDVFSFGDTGGLFTRLINLNYTTTDHFTAFTGWTWASDTHDGTPSKVNTTDYPSWVTFNHNTTSTNHFAYKTYSGNGDFYARLWLNMDSYGGLRFDDGSNNNVIEIRLEQAATYGFRNVVSHHTVGGVLTTTTLLSNLYALNPLMILLIKSSTIYAVGIQDHAPTHTRLTGSEASAWTPTRYGFIFGQRVSTVTDYRRMMAVDWIRYV